MIGAPDLTRDSEGPELSIDYLPHVETKNPRAPDLPFGSAKGEPELEPGCIKKNSGFRNKFLYAAGNLSGGSSSSGFVGEVPLNGDRLYRWTQIDRRWKSKEVSRLWPPDK